MTWNTWSPRFAGTMALLASTGVAVSGAPDDPVPVAKPIEFAKVPREVQKLPEFAGQPRYGLFLFGLNGEVRIWAALDSSGDDGHDVLYVDLDGDGDLTESGERFSGKSDRGSWRFEVGELAVPGTDVVHEDFELTAHAERVSYKMKWRGEKATMGAYGPDSKSYGDFGESIADAPIFVPGYDRPFTFERWYGGTLTPGQTTDFKVFVGNRGDRTGAFTCVDDEFLPDDEYPVATLIYRDRNDEEQQLRAKLTRRC